MHAALNVQPFREQFYAAYHKYYVDLTTFGADRKAGVVLIHDRLELRHYAGRKLLAIVSSGQIFLCVFTQCEVRKWKDSVVISNSAGLNDVYGHDGEEIQAYEGKSRPLIYLKKGVTCLATTK